MRDDKPDLLDWLGLRRDPDYSKARWLGGLIAVSAAALLVVLFVGSVVAFIGAVMSGDPEGTALRNTGLVLAAMIGVPFLVWRSVVAQKQVDVAEQGHITDRINTAVAGLGADKEESRLMRNVRYTRDGRAVSDFEGRDRPMDLPEGAEPEYGDWQVIRRSRANLEVRIGAVYALERIAQDSGRDHVQIMEILCAYVRQNAPASLAQPFPDEWEKAFAAKWDAPDVTRPDRAAIREWARGLAKPREDVQVALNVLGRRSPRQIALEGGKDAEGAWQGYELDLRETCLQGADMAQGQFDHARLDRARMQGADLVGAQMQGANLVGAQMQGADLARAQMQGAFPVSAQMQGADLARAQMQGVSLFGAQMQGADLFEAQMQGAFLVSAQMQGAFLAEARMQGANLREAQMQGANLTGARMDAATELTRADLAGAALMGVDLAAVSMTEAQLERTFGDASVTLPAGASRPAHWLGTQANWPDFYDQWRAWQ